MFYRLSAVDVGVCVFVVVLDSWVLMFVCLVFFFQAEDGIRDLVRSRGLGDVYKRQAESRGQDAGGYQRDGELFQQGSWIAVDWVAILVAVSYTHLTLPTIYSV